MYIVANIYEYVDVASASTAKISSKAEASILTTLAISLSSAFSEIITFMLEWDDQPELNAYVAINYDFYDENISGEELLKYMRAWQAGGLSRSAYFNLLQKKETYPEGWSESDEFNEIQEQMSQMYNLSDEQYLELKVKLDDLSERLKLSESAGITNLIAEGMKDSLEGIESAEKIKQFEEGVVQETTAVEDESISEEETIENN